MINESGLTQVLSISQGFEEEDQNRVRNEKATCKIILKEKPS